MNKMREADFIFWGKGFCIVIILCKMFIAACFYQYGIFLGDFPGWGFCQAGIASAVFSLGFTDGCFCFLQGECS